MSPFIENITRPKTSQIVALLPCRGVAFYAGPKERVTPIKAPLDFYILALKIQIDAQKTNITSINPDEMSTFTDLFTVPELLKFKTHLCSGMQPTSQWAKIPIQFSRQKLAFFNLVFTMC